MIEWIIEWIPPPIAFVSLVLAIVGTAIVSIPSWYPEWKQHREDERLRDSVQEEIDACRKFLADQELSS